MKREIMKYEIAITLVCKEHIKKYISSEIIGVFDDPNSTSNATDNR